MRISKSANNKRAADEPLFEAVEKVAKRHFFEFFHPVLAPMARSAPNAKYENLWVFIRSDAHVVRAGLNIRGCGPLSDLGFFDRLGLPQSGSHFYLLLIPSVDKDTQGFRSQTARHNCVVLI